MFNIAKTWYPLEKFKILNELILSQKKAQQSLSLARERFVRTITVSQSLTIYLNTLTNQSRTLNNSGPCILINLSNVDAHCQFMLDNYTQNC